MNRRDIIIIATLLNGAILALLFVLANSNEDAALTAPPEIAQEFVATALPSHAASPLPTLFTTQPEIVSQDNESDFHSFELSPEELMLNDDEEAFFESNETTKDVVHNKIVDVTIKSGDVLERVAKVNGTTVEAIKALNNLRGERLRIGQVLKVPVGTVTTTAIAKPIIEPVKNKIPKQPSPAGDESYYTIKSGDNPWKIARRFNVKMDDLLRLNHLDEEKARNLKVGDRIRIR